MVNLSESLLIWKSPPLIEKQTSKLKIWTRNITHKISPRNLRSTERFFQHVFNFPLKEIREASVIFNLKQEKLQLNAFKMLMNLDLKLKGMKIKN
jgi:hypothetical protein